MFDSVAQLISHQSLILDSALRFLFLLRDIMHTVATNTDSVACKTLVWQLLECSGWIWHDTLATLLAICPKDPQHAAVKKAVLDSWRKYGVGFHTEGVNPSTSNEPSQLSDERRYWKIRRRCFWNGCACSISGAFHRFRVCKRCWRVLYCTEKCQRS